MGYFRNLCEKNKNIKKKRECRTKKSTEKTEICAFFYQFLTNGFAYKKIYVTLYNQRKVCKERWKAATIV